MNAEEDDLEATVERIKREAAESPVAAGAEAHLVGCDLGREIADSFIAWIEEKVTPPLMLAAQEGGSPREAMEQIVVLLRSTADSFEQGIADLP